MSGTAEVAAILTSCSEIEFNVLRDRDRECCVVSIFYYHHKLCYWQQGHGQLHAMLLSLTKI